MRILIEHRDGQREEVEESKLQRLDGTVDTPEAYTTWVEYRFPGSDRVVHRSAHVQMKQWPAGLQAVLGDLG